MRNCHFWRKYCTLCENQIFFRDGSRAAAASKMERFVIIVNGNIQDGALCDNS